MPLLIDLPTQKVILDLAQNALENAVNGRKPEKLNLSALPQALQEPGASFVTLTIGGDLRGCIGSLQAYQPLALDIQAHAADAALRDPRFRPVRAEELPQIDLEVSVLSAPIPLTYAVPGDLPKLLRPGIDGVVLGLGRHQATFLPQVWEQLPTPEEFLGHLCQKAGLPTRIWQEQLLEVSTYQVQEIR